jgi:HPt (histidine-containing phosphotransfer) domain-containing protein
MFSGQAVRLMLELAAPSSDRGALVHTLKGSARAIGAFRVAEAAEFLEAALRQGGDPSEALDALADAVAGARMAIEEILRRS